MIINFDGYGKLIVEQRNAIKCFRNRFAYNNYYFDPYINSLPLEVDETDLPYDDERKDTITGIVNKSNFEDVSALINPEADKHSSTFEKIGCGYKNANVPYALLGDFSCIVLDTFMYIKGEVPSDYQVILMQPEETIKKVHVGEGVYWGVSAFNGGFLFSHNYRDNRPVNYTKDVNGFGVKFLLKDSSGNVMDAARVNVVYTAGKATGISFEISMDAITAARLHKNKSLYGSKGFTEEVAAYIDGDRYREKLVDALLGLIGMGTSLKNFDEVSSNFAKVFTDAVASVMIIRGDSFEDIEKIYDSMAAGLDVKSPNLKNVIIEMIKDKYEEILEFAKNRPYITQKKPQSLRELAVKKEMLKEGKREFVRSRSIKKPQV